MKPTQQVTLTQEQARSRYVGIFPLEFEEGKQADSAGVIPDLIHLIPIGQWDHDLYGQITITAANIREFAQNFDAGIRKGVPITAGHEGMQEQPAVGWIKRVEVRDDGLWGFVEWNESGKGLLSDKAFKFFSPEFYQQYEDAQTHQLYANVLVGGALTKAPYFKELSAVVFSEPILKTFNQPSPMNLQELLAKKLEDLTDEEKSFIKEHKAELTEEQKTAVTSIIDEPETEEQKAAREKTEADEKAAADAKAKEDANVAAGLNPDGTEKVEASEKKMVQISATELHLLRENANKGQQAFAELEKKSLDEAVGKMVYSETNKAGRFLPKSSASVRTFMEGLNPTQRLAFAALVVTIPQKEIFTEIGTGMGGEGTAKAEVEAKIEKKMSENKELKYSDALRLVMSENEGLEKRYDMELTPVRG